MSGIIKLLWMCAIFYLIALSYAVNLKVIKHGPRYFPSGFLFGAASAAYQIEGGWNTDGKSENIWDYMTHNYPCSTDDCSNGDIATDSYNMYKKDVQLLRELGVDFYRFSISWSRLLPTSFPDKINKAGVLYYNNLIDELLKYNIEPMITLYHWDLPQKLQKMGGWTNPHIVDWFADYARVAFETFGDRVKYWITVNEPREICFQGYGDDKNAPRLNITGIAEYLCSKNLLMAHAKAYHIYNSEYKPKWKGVIGITICGNWFEPETDKDQDASEAMMQFHIGQYIHPIFSKVGGYPEIMKTRIAAKSAQEGFRKSRLPEFTQEEINFVKGSSDFLGLNHYTTFIVRSDNSSNYPIPSYLNDIGSYRYQPDDWEGSASIWLKTVPWGFYKFLTQIRETYNNPTIIITENGFSSRGGLVDDDRVAYYKSYLDAMLDAIEEGSTVHAYTAWSLIDNFEWMRGYTERFGLYEVDFESPERTRTPRKSAFVYKEIIRTCALDYHYEPNTTYMTVAEGH